MGELEMYPLDLEEFAKALGIGEEVMGHLKECYENQTKVDEFIHKKMLELVTLYMIVGGMPSAVQKYLDTNNLRNVLNEQRDIIRTYKRDITKYEKERKLQIEEIYNLIPAELNAKNKRFVLKELSEKARFARYESGFLWLKDAGVAIPTYNVEAPKIPLLLNKQRNLFKLFLNDVGLLAAMYGGDIQVRLLSSLNVNYGAAFENLVAQELYAHGFATDHDLFYFNSKKQGELDFVVEYQGEVLPIEVKSGKAYERHRALSNIMDNEEYAIPNAIVFCQENIQIKNRLVYLPIYMLMFLQHEQNNDLTYQFDLTGLK
jgi:predicted AAA+ superfamily ATPase